MGAGVFVSDITIVAVGSGVITGTKVAGIWVAVEVGVAVGDGLILISIVGNMATGDWITLVLVAWGVNNTSVGD